MQSEKKTHTLITALYCNHLVKKNREDKESVKSKGFGKPIKLLVICLMNYFFITVDSFFISSGKRLRRKQRKRLQCNSIEIIIQYIAHTKLFAANNSIQNCLL